MAAGLVVKILLEGAEFAFFLYVAHPPGLQEAESVAEELDEGGFDAEKSDDQRAVAHAAVGEDEHDEQEDGQERKHPPQAGGQAEQLHTAGAAGVGPEAQRDGADEQEDDADGEEGRQCVYQSGGAGVAEAEVDACDATPRPLGTGVSCGLPR